MVRSGNRVSGPIENKLTPRFYVKGDDRFRSWLSLSLLLLLVFCKSLLPNPGSFSILLFVVAAKKIDIVVVIVIGSFSGIHGQSRRLGAVSGCCLAWVAGELREFRLMGSGVLVPAVGMRIFLNRGWALESLKAFHVGLGGTVSRTPLEYATLRILQRDDDWANNKSELRKARWKYSYGSVLSRLINTDQNVLIKGRK